MLARVLDHRRPLDAALEEEAGRLQLLEPRDEAYARALVRATLRRLGSIDRILSRLIERPLPRKAQRVRHVLRVAAAQALFLRTPDHAVVATAVDLLKRDAATAGFAGLANAVLRRLSRDKAGLLAALPPEADTPEWLWARWVRQYGEEVAAGIAAAHREEPPLDFMVKSHPAVWAERLGGLVLPTGGVRIAAKGAVDRLPGYEAGAWWVQDAAATLPVRLLGDVAGRRVADLCAAPGGKTAALALAGAEVTAVDVSAERAARLADNLKRLALPAEIVVADLNEWQAPAPFDAILLDAPCSSTGTIRRHPDVPWLKHESDIGKLAELQQKMLHRAGKWLKPGGVLVFCTCSLEREEGEDQVERIRASDAGLEWVPADPRRLPGDGRFLAGGNLRTLPNAVLAEDPPLAGMDGFFAACFRRA